MYLSAIRRAAVLVLIGLSPVVTASAQPIADSAARQDALVPLQARRYSEAAQLYERFVRADSTDAVSWQRLGLALYGLDQYARAAAAFERAAVLQPAVVSSLFRAAKSYARLNDAEQARDAMQRAIAAGFANESAYANDADLAPMRSDPRFADVAAHLSAAAHPCAANEAFHQLDFWMGSWDQTGRDGGQSLGTTTVTTIAGGCALHENTVNPPNYSATALHFFDPRSSRWRQEYVDSRGRPTQWEGMIVDGVMRYLEIVPPGTSRLHRNTMSRLSSDRIRWLFEESNDGGATWRAVFDGFYVRRGSARGS